MREAPVLVQVVTFEIIIKDAKYAKSFLSGISSMSNAVQLNVDGEDCPSPTYLNYCQLDSKVGVDIKKGKNG